ncbi:MAG TPA: TlpA disulfide reductase family protein [Polyangia bacterium]
MNSVAAATMIALVLGVAGAEASQPAPRPVPPHTRRDVPRPAPGNGAKGDSGPEVVILDGAAIGARMREARGHGLFVHLWASWCGPCLAELPTIDLFARAARARGATFLSVSLDDVARGTHVAEVLREKAPNLTRILARFEDPDRFMAVFSREWEGGIPALFGYDAHGRLAGSLMGEADVEDLDRLLENLTAPVAAPRPPLRR